MTTLEINLPKNRWYYRLQKSTKEPETCREDRLHNKTSLYWGPYTSCIEAYMRYHRNIDNQIN